jgi:hypothetical protein
MLSLQSSEGCVLNDSDLERLHVAQTVVQAALKFAKPAALFNAFNATIADTDLKVGDTDEDNDPARWRWAVADYLSALESAKEEPLAYGVEHGASLDEAVLEYNSWRLNLYEGIASRVIIPLIQDGLVFQAEGNIATQSSQAA